MTGVFKQKTPANILLLFLFGMLIKIPVFLHPHVPVSQPKDGPLFRAILSLLSDVGKSSSFVSALAAYILIYIQAAGLNKVINDNRMMQRQTFLPGMAYLIVTSLVPEWNYFSAPLFVNTILILVLAGLFRTHNMTQAKGIIFNVGMGIGICSFIFFPSVIFIIWAIFGLMLMRPFRLNEWLICILGMTTPYYFYLVYLFLTNQWGLDKILPYIDINLPRFRQSIWIAVSSFFLCALFILGGYYVQNNLRRMLIQVRKAWSIVLLYLLAAILVPFFNSGNTLENWVIAAVPLAAFHGCAYIYSEKKIFQAVLFWLVIVFIIIYQQYSGAWVS